MQGAISQNNLIKHVYISHPVRKYLHLSIENLVSTTGQLTK